MRINPRTTDPMDAAEHLVRTHGEKHAHTVATRRMNSAKKDNTRDFYASVRIAIEFLTADNTPAPVPVPVDAEYSVPAVAVEVPESIDLPWPAIASLVLLALLAPGGLLILGLVQ